MNSFPLDSVLLPDRKIRWADLFGSGLIYFGVAISKKDADEIKEEMEVEKDYTIDSNQDITGYHQVLVHKETGCVRSLIVILGGRVTRDEPHFHAAAVHEAVHAWRAYLDEIEEKTPGHEIEAYGIQTIYEFIRDEFDRRTE